VRYDVYDRLGAIHWKWMDDPMLMPWYRYLITRSLKWFAGESGKVLEIGSGDGVMAYYLTSMGFEVVGIEPEQEGIKLCKEKVPTMTVLEGNIEDIELPEADYLYSLNTIEHVSKPERFVEAMKKIKNWGVVITDDVQLRKGGKYHTKEYSLDELKDLFKDFRTEVLDLGRLDFIGLKIHGN